MDKNLVESVEKIVYNCWKDSPDLFGYSILDLVADNLSNPLEELKQAIVAANFRFPLDIKIKNEIFSYMSI